MRIGDAVKEKRLSLNMTQAQLAEASGVNATHISRIENHSSTPRDGTLGPLADAMKTTLEDLWARVDEKPTDGRTRRGKEQRLEEKATTTPYIAKIPGAVMTLGRFKFEMLDDGESVRLSLVL